jgi:hypothetical protein
MHNNARPFGLAFIVMDSYQVHLVLNLPVTSSVCIKAESPENAKELAFEIMRHKALDFKRGEWHPSDEPKIEDIEFVVNKNPEPDYVDKLMAELQTEEGQKEGENA